MARLSTLLLALCFALLTSPLAAQADSTDTRAPRELGIRLNGINLGGQNDFNLMFKKGRKPERYTRISAALFDLSFRTSPNIEQQGIAVGLTLGSERRRRMSEHLDLCTGFDFGTRIQWQENSNTNTETSNFSFSTGLVFGVQYYAGHQAFVNLEVVPQAAIGFSRANGETTTNLGLNFSSLGLLTVGFRF